MNLVNRKFQLGVKVFLIVCIVAGIFLRVLWFIRVSPNFMPAFDGEEYFHYASNFFLGRGWGDGFSCFRRAPLYPIWLVIWYGISGGSLIVPVIAQLILSIVTIPLMYLLTYQMFYRRLPALAAAALTAL